MKTFDEQSPQRRRSPQKNVRNIELISDSFGLRICLTVWGLFDKLV